MQSLMNIKDKKKVAIVILNWNGAALMERFLPSVVRYSPEEMAEVVVADNGSTDDSLALLAEKFPSVRVVRFAQNYGFAEGYNRALQQIDTPYAVLLNSDVEVTPGWLEAPLRRLEASPEVAAVQPKLLAERARDQFEYAGAAGGFMDKYGYPFCRGRIFQEIETDRGQYDAEADILWATGACLFVRTEVYRAVGGLDAKFFAHQEEIDMCWRMRARGYRLVCTPESVVYHVGGGTLNAESPRKTFLNFRNNLLMLYKNLPEKELHRVMRLRFWLDYLAALKFLLEGHPANARAVREARREFHRLVPEYRETRIVNQQLAVVKEIPELKSFSLLWQFYVRGKKHYGQLPQ